ncbi:MAG: preprotein translocase subunit YajC [Candidatus Bipolaricaulota bacterium]|nr:preprotein translocase subunit YajC [Candidatus Bipolaricaulota bacterium]
MSVFNKAESTALPSSLGHALIWAQAQQPPTGESWITLIIMLALMMVFFYFFLVRPQRKRQQEHQALLESLRRGDEVVTIGGIYGKIVKIDKDYVTLQVNDEGTTMRVLKESITQKEKAA